MLRRLTFALAFVTLVVGMVYVAWVSFSPREGSAVEDEIIVEAFRVRHGLELYVDPHQGTTDSGSPPSRYFVLYTPTFSMLLGHLPAGSLEGIRFEGRLVSLISWGLALLLVTRVGRGATLAGLLSAGSVFLLRNVGASPDCFAMLFVALGLTRFLKRGVWDPWVSLSLVAAPFVKPSAVGVVLGMHLAHLLVVRKRALVGFAMSAAWTAAFLVGCHVASDGQWFVHLRNSTFQTLSWDRFVEEFGARALVLGVPHLVVLLLGVLSRANPYGIGALGVSLLWSTFSMAKHGSGSHYFLEPTLAAVALLTTLDPSRLPGRVRTWGTVGAFALCVVSAAISLPAYVRGLRARGTLAALYDAVSKACARGPEEVVLSSWIGVEVDLNGRFLVPVWQTSYLARAGRFPLSHWERDLRHKNVAWLVTERGDEGTPPEVRGKVEVHAFRRELRSVVEECFVPAGEVGPLLLRKKRALPACQLE